jgi:transglutaminase-like putative cysteine protease
VTRASRTKLAIALGLGSLLTGAFLVARQRGHFRGVGLFGLGKDDVVRTVAPPPPMVSRNKVAGMELQLYRANNIPIDTRVGLIQKRVWEGVNDPRIRKLALELTRACGRNDGQCETQRVYEAVKRKVRYTGDVAPVKHPDGTVEPIDYFQSPWRTWEFGGGDCDDHSGLIAALLSSIGVPVRLRVTAPTKISDWGHIYPVAGLPKETPKKWFAVDTTLPGRTRLADEARYGRKRDYVPHKDYPA